MKKYNLTNEEIDQLYDFTKSHYVEYYDLQTELVDHLANGIEAIIYDNPSITFEDALQMEFKKFGIFGFSDVIENHTNMMMKKYAKIVWKQFLSFFTFQKSAIVLTIYLGLFFVIKNLEHLYILVVLLVILMFFSISKIKRTYRFNVSNKLNEKRWLLKEMILNHGHTGIFLLVPMQILLSLSSHKDFSIVQNNFLVGFVTLFIVLYGLFTYICLYDLPNKVEEFLHREYNC